MRSLRDPATCSASGTVGRLRGITSSKAWLGTQDEERRRTEPSVAFTDPRRRDDAEFTCVNCRLNEDSTLEVWPRA